MGGTVCITRLGLLRATCLYTRDHLTALAPGQSSGGGDFVLVGLVASEKRGFEEPEEARPIIGADRARLQKLRCELFAGSPGRLNRLKLAARFQMARGKSAPVCIRILPQRLAFITGAGEEGEACALQKTECLAEVSGGRDTRGAG
jgi:hypothetical protein